MHKILLFITLILFITTPASSNNKYSACIDRALSYARNNGINCQLADLSFNSNCFEIYHSNACEENLEKANKNTSAYDYTVDCNVTNVQKNTYNCLVYCGTPKCLYNCASNSIKESGQNNSYITPPTIHTGSTFIARRDGYVSSISIRNTISGTASTGGLECSSCPANSQCSNGQISGCNNGYEYKDGQCKKSYVCPDNAAECNADNSISRCNENYFITNPGITSNACTECPVNSATCGPYSNMECAATYYRPDESSAICTKCPQYSTCLIGATKDQTGVVGLTCEGDTHLESGKCVCSTNGHGSCNNDGTLICDAGYIKLPTDSGYNSCTNCRAGYFCPTAGGGQNPCPAGAYCPKESKTPQDCPAGYFCLGTTDYKCTSTQTNYCPKDGIEITLTDGTKQYCRNNCLVPANCPAGAYCEAKSPSPTSCPNPWNNSAPNSTKKTDCYATLSPGKYINNGTTNNTCPGGSYCPGGNIYYNGTGRQECPEGHYCPENSSKPTPCPAGTYQNGTGKKSETDCKPCDAGTYQDATGQNSCKPCTDGKYQDATGQKSCKPCTAGYYCPEGSSSQKICDAGNYCPENSSAPTRCPGYGTNNNNNSFDQYLRTTHPTKAYYNEQYDEIRAATIGYRTGLQSKTDCAISYIYENARGEFHADSVGFNNTSNKYDLDAWQINKHYNNGTEIKSRTINSDQYYKTANPGYYLKDEYNLDYCKNGCKKDPTYCNYQYHLYRNAEPCPAGQYCTGAINGLMCKDNRDQYPETLGYDGKVSAGYYSSGGAKTATPSSSDCVKKSDGTANTCGPCPDRLKTHYRNKMPTNFHLNEGDQPTKTWFPASHAGAEAITGCHLSYTYTNDRGMFSQDSVPYSTATGRYDNGFENNSTGTPVIYYNVIFPGYYGKTQVYDNNNCDTSKYQLYQDAQKCPAGKYCLGRISDKTNPTYKEYINLKEMDKCTKTTYDETNYIDAPMAGGYFATCGAKSATPTHTNPTYTPIGDGCVQPSDYDNGCYCGPVSQNFYSTGGGTAFSPTEPGKGCLADFKCGVCPAGNYCPSGTSTPPENQNKCDEGYYCPNKPEASGRGRKECPGGTTSVKGASAEEQCYIMGGDNGTKFCVQDICFNIPNHFGPNAPETN